MLEGLEIGFKEALALESGAVLAADAQALHDRRLTNDHEQPAAGSQALFKARLIGMYFMDLRTAPLALRVCFDAYCLVLWAVLCGMYVWS